MATPRPGLVTERSVDARLEPVQDVRSSRARDRRRRADPERGLRRASASCPSSSGLVGRRKLAAAGPRHSSAVPHRFNTGGVSFGNIPRFRVVPSTLVRTGSRVRLVCDGPVFVRECCERSEPPSPGTRSSRARTPAEFGNEVQRHTKIPRCVSLSSSVLGCSR